MSKAILNLNWDKVIPFFEKPDILASEEQTNVKDTANEKAQVEQTKFRGYNTKSPIKMVQTKNKHYSKALIYCPTKKELVKEDDCKCNDYNFEDLFD